MAVLQKKITDLQLRSGVTDGLNIPADDGIQSYRITALQLLNYILPAGAITAAKLAYSAVTGQTLDSAPALADEVLTGDTSAAALKKATLAKIAALSRAKNYASNGEFRFWQRQTPGTLTSRQDDAYSADRWYILNSGGAVNMQGARVAEVIASSPTPYVAQFRNADATARQFGPAQIIESDRAIALRGKTVTFSFWARTDGTEVPNIRAGVIEWTGTADSVTSDVVSSWSATPGLIANAAFINTPADLALTATMQQFSITVTLGTTFNNLVLFIWTPSTEAQNDDFYLTQVQLVEFSEALPWNHIRKTYAEDLSDCQRYFEKSYVIDTAPGTNITAGGQYIQLGAAVGNNLGWSGTVNMKCSKRVSPTVLPYDIAGTPARVDCGGVSVSSVGDYIGNGSFITVNGSGSGQGSAGTFVRYHWTADAEL